MWLLSGLLLAGRKIARNPLKSLKTDSENGSAAFTLGKEIYGKNTKHKAAIDT